MINLKRCQITWKGSVREWVYRNPVCFVFHFSVNLKLKKTVYQLKRKKADK